MPRDSQERQRLLALIADYCLENGVADLTLRRVGQAIGTNNRMLLYYFESKEHLIETALDEAAVRFPTLVSALDLLDDDAPLADRLGKAWKAISSEVNLPFTRLFFEVFGLAAHQPGRFDVYLSSVGTDWTNRVAGVFRREGFSAGEARVSVRQIVALWRGLQFDLLSSGDRRGIDKAHAAAVRQLTERERLP